MCLSLHPSPFTVLFEFRTVKVPATYESVMGFEPTLFHLGKVVHHQLCVTDMEQPQITDFLLLGFGVNLWLHVTWADELNRTVVLWLEARYNSHYTTPAYELSNTCTSCWKKPIRVPRDTCQPSLRFLFILWASSRNRTNSIPHYKWGAAPFLH